jgi:hypothetical protein
MDGEPGSELRLSFVNDASGGVVELGTVSGPPRAAAISPTGEFIAYITDIGLSGASQVSVARLSDGMTQVLGCGMALQFADRLAWSDDGRFLAYTLAAVDVGGGTECGGVTGDGSTTDAYVYDAGATGESFKVTDAGNAFAADFLRSPTLDGEYKLLVSYAGVQPYSEPVLVLTGESVQSERANAFMPLVSADGQRALFWRGEMARNEGGGWRIERGGMVYVTGEPVDGQPTWSGEPLFADLALVGGEGFQVGEFGWGLDSDQVVFWGGEWTGAPQSDDGKYPSSDVYVGRVSAGLLTRESRVEVGLTEQQRVEAVALAADGESVLVTAVQPAAGDLAVPSASLMRATLAGGEPRLIGIGGAWTGPAVIGYEAVVATP